MGTRPWPIQFASFAGVGAVATATQYVILFLGVQLLGVHPVAASTVGFALSALLNYWLNHRLTFVSALPHRRALPRFALVVAVGLGLTSAFMWLGVEVLDFHYLLAQLGTTALVLIWNFVASRLWAFYDPARTDESLRR